MAKEKRITPVELAAQAFGDQVALARVLGRSPSAISQWIKGNATRAPGDFASVADVRRVKDAAALEGKVISLEDLIYGRVVHADGK